MKKKDVKDIKLCHGTDSEGKMIHLVYTKDGRTIEKSTTEMRSLGLLKVRGGRTHA